MKDKSSTGGRRNDPAGRNSGFNDQRIPTARVLERLG
jgi:hypothetical protein